MAKDEEATMTAQPLATVEDQTLRLVRVCAIVLISLGLLFRFTGLGSKVFWWDETHTGRAISGSLWSEIVAEVFDGRVHTRDEILVYQYPRAGKTMVDTIKMLVWEDPKHTPLYFVLARAWVNEFGPSTTILRAFSAFLSIISFPLVFLLGRVLFRRSLEGWIAVGLFAVSPLHLVYAQEARQYMLWVDLVLLASWLLLLALNRTSELGRPAWLWFFLYTGAIGLTLITHLLTVLVMAAHLFFIVANERFRLTIAVWLTAAAQFVVALLFLPWALSILAVAQHRAWIPWVATDVTIARWLRMVVGSYARPLFDVDAGIAGLKFIDQVAVVFVMMVVLIGVVLMVRWAPRQSRLFLLLLGLTCSMPMIAVDLFSGGWRTVVIRYQFPVVIAMQLCVAFAIARLLTSRERRWRRAGAGMATLLVVCGVFSCILYGRTDVWWSKGRARSLLAATEYVERWPEPLVVLSGMGTSLSLAHASSDRVRFLCVEDPETPIIQDEFEDVFLFRVSEAMLNRLTDSGWQVEEVDAPDLYRLFRPAEEIAAGSPPSS